MAALSTATAILIGSGLAAAGGVASTLLAPKGPKPITSTYAPTMPDADDKKVQQAKKRSMIRQSQRSGRQSTILTGDSNNDTLGG